MIMVTFLIKGVCAKLKYSQASGMNIIDNISEFERLYNPMKCYDMDFFNWCFSLLSFEK